MIPGVVVDAVVEEPFACHPSFAQGYYDRDNAFYLEWDRIARDPGDARGLARRNGSTTWRRTPSTVEKWGAAHWDALRPGDAMSGQVNYGRYA